MAELVLSTVGQAIGASLPGALGTIGATLGRIGGAYLGRSIDQRLFSTAIEREAGRLTDLHLQGSTEGASIPAVYGSVRIAGQVIWAARFKEHVAAESSGGGKGGGPSVTTRTYTYTLSFAVGLCEGEIARIGRAWANGEELDLSRLAWRLHKGGEDQAPDPLIEAIEGGEGAPAYRGLAYVVFEDLPLAPFGNTIPQLSFEIIRPAPAVAERFQDRVKGVCLIPGAGEFVYATTPVLRRSGPGEETAENVHMARERANVLVSLDQLAADFPSCETVQIVAAWFGDDLRCSACTIRPGVEIAQKETHPHPWRAGGVLRPGARLISQHDGGPAFGGTPSDRSVRDLIVELKARGYKVGLYPFVMMDIPAGNALPDPYGGAAQAAYPWRGRITLDPAPGQPGSPDKSAAAAAQMSAFFGAAAPGDFGEGAALPTYDGPDEWSYRRFILHYAKLAALAGGVDAFIIGSELRGLTTARAGSSDYLAVTALKQLAGDVRALLPAAKLTYAADWSEYSGHRPQDGSGDLFFHLDPLWADADIDAVGVDWYPPLTDWRSGAGHLDAAEASSVYEPAYLQSRIEGGEYFDWHYASDEDRMAQTRTPITDEDYGEPWVHRAKDLRSFWANPHHNRPGGVRDPAATAWVPQSKPIWLIELGCAAIDNGANAPNRFLDPKSSESALPPFSSGARDDLIQRRTLDAYLAYWSGPANPVSSLDGRKMIEQIHLWCWDARPYPAFPARTDVWSDGASWRRGHWLNGRAGLSDLAEVVAHICGRAGVSEIDASALLGAVGGFVVDAPASARAALEPLMAAYDFDAAERDGEIVFFQRGESAVVQVALEHLAEGSDADAFATRGDAAEAPVEARVRFLDAARDYRIAGVSARRLDRADGGVATIEAPLVLETEAAEALAQRVLAERRAAAERLSLVLGPAHLALEPGDRLVLAAGGDVFEIARIEDVEARRLELRRARSSRVLAGLADPSAPQPPAIAPTPAFAVIDLPPLPGAEDDERPLAAVFAAPWLGRHELYAGEPATLRAAVEQPAIVGELVWPLWPGAVDRWDDANRLRVKLYGGALASVSREAVLGGANAFAIEADGEWEIVQARSCVLVDANEYELSGLLRGRLGSAHAMRAPHPIGARVVKLDQRLARVDVGAHEWIEPLEFTAPPAGAAASDLRAARAAFTLPHAAARPWAPAHVRAQRLANGDVAVSWIRCARVGGDSWGPGEPPLGTPGESYRLEVLDGAEVRRVATTDVPSFVYPAADQTADFGQLPASLRLRVAQLDGSGATGLNTELTITL